MKYAGFVATGAIAVGVTFLGMKMLYILPPKKYSKHFNQLVRGVNASVPKDKQVEATVIDEDF